MKGIGKKVAKALKDYFNSPSSLQGFSVGGIAIPFPKEEPPKPAASTHKHKRHAKHGCKKPGCENKKC
jgi:hypothetical protein